MAGNVKVAPFKGTAEQIDTLRKKLNEMKSEQGALMPALQVAQEIFGYLPIEVQRVVSEELELPLEQIYGVVTFYSQFSLNPKGKYTISVCLGTACYVKGAGDIFDRLSQKLNIGNSETTEDGLFTLEACRCIGACGLAPVLTVNEDVHGRLTTDDVDGILAQYNI